MVLLMACKNTDVGRREHKKDANDLLIKIIDRISWQKKAFISNRLA